MQIAVPPDPAGSSLPICRCGHDRHLHEHYRRGTDCALCGSAVCPRYRPDRGRPDRGGKSRIGAFLHRRR